MIGACLTSPQNDLGVRHGGTQEPLSTGGDISGQPPTGGRQKNHIQLYVFTGNTISFSISSADENKPNQRQVLRKNSKKPPPNISDIFYTFNLISNIYL